MIDIIHNYNLIIKILMVQYNYSQYFIMLNLLLKIIPENFHKITNNFGYLTITNITNY